MSFQNTRPNLYVSTKFTKELKIGKLLPEWRPSAFSKYSTKFICFHKGHKRTENWKAFTKCLFKILCQINFSTKVTKEWKIERLSPEWRPSVFWKYSTKFIFFHKSHKKMKIGRLSPEWQPSVFSKYYIKFIYFHKGHKRNENWKSFTWMATKCLFKKLDQIYLFPQKSQKNWILEGFHLNGD